jgi:hypothetical protein
MTARGSSASFDGRTVLVGVCGAVAGSFGSVAGALSGTSSCVAVVPFVVELGLTSAAGWV